MTFSKIRLEVADYLGLGRASDKWTTTDKSRLASIINGGYRRFLQTPGHRWTFLEPVMQIAVVSGTSEYPLDPSFGWPVGDLTYASSDNRWHLVRLVSEAVIRAEQQASGSTTGSPRIAAIRPGVVTNAAAQTSVLILHPTPDSDYTLSLRYGVAVSDVSESFEHLYGGELYGDVILQACLAMAELRIRGEIGPQEAAYQKLLAGAVERDAKRRGAWYGDYGGQRERYRQTYEVTYNGVLYDGEA